MPDKFTSNEAEKTYLQNFFDTATDHTMVIFTGGSAQGNHGTVGSRIVTKNKVLHLNLQRKSLPMVLAIKVDLNPANSVLTSLLKILQMLKLIYIL